MIELNQIYIYLAWPGRTPDEPWIGFGVSRRLIKTACYGFVLTVAMALLCYGLGLTSWLIGVIAWIGPIIFLVVNRRANSSYRYYQINTEFNAIAALDQLAPAQLAGRRPIRRSAFAHYRPSTKEQP